MLMMPMPGVAPSASLLERLEAGALRLKMMVAEWILRPFLRGGCSRGAVRKEWASITRLQKDAGYLVKRGLGGSRLTNLPAISRSSPGASAAKKSMRSSAGMTLRRTAVFFRKSRIAGRSMEHHRSVHNLEPYFGCMVCEQGGTSVCFA